MDLNTLNEELKSQRNRLYLAEWRVKTYRRVFIAIAVIAVIALIHANNYRIVLIAHGLTETKILTSGQSHYSDRSFLNGNRIADWFTLHQNRIIFCERSESIVYLRRNRLGFWSVLFIQRHDPEWGWGLSYSWSGEVNWNAFAQTGSARDITPLQGWHIFYYNTNATSKISPDMELLPSGFAVNVWQSRNRYWVHFMQYYGRDYNGTLGLNIHEILGFENPADLARHR